VKQASVEEVFSCRQCGTCCQGHGGIFIHPEQAGTVAEFLGLPVEEFVREYTFPKHGLLAFKVDAEEYCVMHDYQTHGCLIHPVKPVMCRDWPFFPAPLKYPEEFEVIKRSCPGLHRRATWESFVAFYEKIIKKPPPAPYLYDHGRLREV